jgi:hypothetical protein
MPRLTPPHVRYRASFLDAVRENVAEGTFIGDALKRELNVYGDTWHEPEGSSAACRGACTRVV